MKKLTLVAGICMLACAFMGCSKKTEKGEISRTRKNGSADKRIC